MKVTETKTKTLFPGYYKTLVFDNVQIPESNNFEYVKHSNSLKVMSQNYLFQQLCRPNSSIFFLFRTKYPNLPTFLSQKSNLTNGLIEPFRYASQVCFRLYDHDNFNEDEYLGCCTSNTDHLFCLKIHYFVLNAMMFQLFRLKIIV